MSNLICLLLLKIQRTKINWFIWLLSLCLYFTFCLCVFLCFCFFLYVSVSMCSCFNVYLCVSLCLCRFLCVRLSPSSLLSSKACHLVVDWAAKGKVKFSFHFSEKLLMPTTCLLMNLGLFLYLAICGRASNLERFSNWQSSIHQKTRIPFREGFQVGAVVQTVWHQQLVLQVEHVFCRKSMPNIAL